jgi:hypothetical protein
MNKTLKSFAVGTQSRQTIALGLAAIIGLASVLPSALAAPPTAHKQPGRGQQHRLQQTARKLAYVPPLDRDDILIVMPNAKAEKEQLSDAFEQVHGQVVAEYGEGEMKIIVVKTEHGKASQTQQKLIADGHFSAVDLNTREPAHWVQPIFKEPKLADSWHLFRMHCPEVYDQIMTSNTPKETIAVLDTGLQGPEVSESGRGADVTGIYKYLALKLAARMANPFFDNSVEDNQSKIESWGNLAATMTLCMTDHHGHGTWVSSSAAGADNGIASLGVNPRAAVYPIRIADGAAGTTVYTDELSEIAAMMVVLQTNIRIVNISYGGVPDTRKKVLHALFKFYHDKRNGLIFTSAGNDGKVLSYPQSPYLIVVSAMEKTDKGLKLADKAVNGVFSSSYGNCVTFTAPGSVINCCGPDGKPATVYGTSFASPIAAGVASLIWSTMPLLKNTQVEQLMIDSCENTTRGRNAKFGYGMPDARKAVPIVGIMVAGK